MAHCEEPDVFHICKKLAVQCEEHARQLAPFAQRYSAAAPDEPEPLHSNLFSGTRAGGFGLLRDLHGLYLMAAECDVGWTVIGQAAQSARDEGLRDVVRRCEADAAVRLRWLRTRIKEAALQAPVVAS